MINATTIVDELRNYNYKFLENDKNGIKINGRNYISRKGEIPILISAPHAVKQYRESQIKLSDYLTGPLAIYLAKKCNCSYFVRTFNDNTDPNYPLGVTLQNIDNEYLLELRNFLKEYKQYLVIDLHGCSDNKLYDCSIWSDNYKTCNQEIIQIFRHQIESYNLSIDNGSEYLGGQVTRQCSLKTDAFQLEVKRKIRTLKLENRHFLESFLESMEKSIYNTYKFYENGE